MIYIGEQIDSIMEELGDDYKNVYEDTYLLTSESVSGGFTDSIVPEPVYELLTVAIMLLVDDIRELEGDHSAYEPSTSAGAPSAPSAPKPSSQPSTSAGATPAAPSAPKPEPEPQISEASGKAPITPRRLKPRL